MEIKQIEYYVSDPINETITINYHTQYNCCVINKVANGKMWEKKLFNLYKTIIKPDDVVLDIGAFIGTHTILFAKLVPQGRVHAFEPIDLPFKCLSLNKHDNKLDNVELYNYIVYDSISSKNIGTNFDGTSSVAELCFIKTYSEYQNVDTIAIDTLNLDKCDFIKIDVERAEWKVLEGAKNTINNFRPTIIMETFKGTKNMDKLKKWCHDNYYESRVLTADNYLLTSV
jgi:FkbM family methyltransferase